MGPTESDQYQEKRKYPRKPCLIAVHCGIKDSVFTNYIQNISYDGVYIETDQAFSVGQEITLRILAPYALKGVNNLMGLVVRVDDKGVAVKFKKEDEKQAEMIKTFVENV